jgi:hypothetical protein
MNIIKTYLDNMFAGLPNTREVNKMKEDLLLNMEEKYLELKENGKTENEAIGIVISEFGNIDELAMELGVNITPVIESQTIVTEEIANEFLEVNKKSGLLIAIGVFLIILSPALLILTASDNDFSSIIKITGGNIIGFVTLFVFVVIAVGLFIYGGMKLEEFSYLKKQFVVPTRVRELVKLEKKKFDPKFVVGLIISVTLYILSPVLVIVFALLNESLGSNDYNVFLAVAILLLIVATATLLIVRVGIIKESHNLLLQIEEYSTNRIRSEKIIGGIAGVYWPLVTGGYLLWSFLGDSWGISWIVWVIAGVVFGAISSLLTEVIKEK